MNGRTPNWYQNAVVYAVDVEAFQDGDGDGIGDFEGLISRLDYLNHLGVDCLWLLPFYPSPNRDNGYDVMDYYGVDPRHGTLGDFVEFLREAEERGIRVLVDLVANHTSDQHPWFKAARSDPDSEYRDYYVWSTDPPDPDSERGSVFPGEAEGGRVWTYDTEAGAYYYHRFYSFQPDLNLQNPAVREAIEKVMGFWLRLGVSGFRIDAATLMIEEKRPGNGQPEDPHELLRQLRAHAKSHDGDVVLLAEADDAPGKLGDYFAGDESGHGRQRDAGGGGVDLLLNFYLDAHLFLALAAERGEPVERALSTLPPAPPGGGWANFLRNYDELNLGRLPAAEREQTFERLAPEAHMRIYGRGIRRRLAPMLDGDRRRVELALSLLFSMPGTPLLVYGDEIGMGEDLSLPGRASVRTPMQWSGGRNAGFSTAPPGKLVRPVVSEGPFAYDRVNVADGWADPDSLLNFVEHLIGTRHETPEIGTVVPDVLDVEEASVFAHRYDAGGETVAMAHNLSAEAATVTLGVGADDVDGTTVPADAEAPSAENGPTADLLGEGDLRPVEGGIEVDLGPYGYRWFRFGGR